MHSFPNKKQRLIIRLFLIIYSFINIEYIYKGVYYCATNLRTCAFTEFLVNYSGGYVRRGLMGEILLSLTSCTGIDPRWFIVPLCLSAYTATIILIYNMGKRANCCLWILALILFSPFSWFLLFRKDCIIFLFLSLILTFIFRKNKHQTIYKLIGICLFIIAINIHECLFFMVAPFLILYFLREYGYFHFTWKGLISTLIIIGSMLLVVLYNGTQTQAQIIHNSWLTFLGKELGTYPTGTIGSLGWESINTLVFHLRVNFSQFFCKGLIVMIMLLLGILYVTPNITLPKWINEKSIVEKRLLFVNMLVFQLISLLPMLTILSCDIYRVISYWIISSFLIYFIVPHSTIKKLIPAGYKKATNKLNALIYHKNSTAISTILLFFTGIPYMGYSVSTAIFSTPIWCYIHKIIEICFIDIDIFRGDIIELL